MRRTVALGALVSALVACNTPDARFRDPVTTSGAGGATTTTGAGGAGGATTTTGVGGAGGGTTTNGGQAPSPTWLRTLASADAFGVDDLATHPSGASTVIGAAYGNVDFGGGYVNAPYPDGFYLARHDATGTLAWATLLGSPDGEPYANAVAEDGEDVVVVGGYDGELGVKGQALPPGDAYGDIFVVRYGADGQALWARKFDGDDRQEAYAAATDAAHATFVGGNFVGDVDFGDGKHLVPQGDTYGDAFLVKLDVNGTTLFSTAIGGAGEQRVTALATWDGDVLVGGYFSGTLELDAKPAAQGQDGFLARLDGATGALEWLRVIGGSGYEQVDRIAVGPAGQIAVTGTFSDDIDYGVGPKHVDASDDVFVALYDAAGTLQWERALGDAALQLSGGIAVDAAGDVIVTGSFFGTIDVGVGPLTNPEEQSDSCKYCLDAYVVKLAGATGAGLWGARYGAADRDLGIDVAASPGGFHLAGQQRGVIDLGGAHATTGPGGFVARFGVP